MGGSREAPWNWWGLKRPRILSVEDQRGRGVDGALPGTFSGQCGIVGGGVRVVRGRRQGCEEAGTTSPCTFVGTGEPEVPRKRGVKGDARLSPPLTQP